MMHHVHVVVKSCIGKSQSGNILKNVVLFFFAN